MLKPFGLSIVVSDATLGRVMIVESAIRMVTLSALAVHISIKKKHKKMRPGLSLATAPDPCHYILFSRICDVQ